MAHGLLLIDKPEGITSNAVVGIVRRSLGRLVKVGHTGTLDPQASGLLVILLGAATRALDFLDEAKKHYQVTVRLGEESDTCDREGTITITGDPQSLTVEEIGKCLGDFKGKIDQIPPHFSAIKKDGVPLYKLARKGVFPSLDVRKVEIFDLSLIDWRPPDLKIDLVCSKGAYARSIARDIGAKLGVGGRVETLRRIASGKFNVATARNLDFVKGASIDEIKQAAIPLDRALEHLPRIEMQEENLRKLVFGRYVATEDLVPGEENSTSILEPEIFRVQDCLSRILILVRYQHQEGRKFLKPLKVFNLLDNLGIE